MQMLFMADTYPYPRKPCLTLLLSLDALGLHNEMTWYDMTWHELKWHDMKWYGFGKKDCGLFPIHVDMKAQQDVCLYPLTGVYM